MSGASKRRAVEHSEDPSHNDLSKRARLTKAQAVSKEAISTTPSDDAQSNAAEPTDHDSLVCEDSNKGGHSDDTGSDADFESEVMKYLNDDTDMTNARSAFEDNAAYTSPVEHSDRSVPFPVQSLVEKQEVQPVLKKDLYESDELIAEENHYFAKGCQRRMIFLSDAVPVELQFAPVTEVTPSFPALRNAVDKFFDWCNYNRDANARIPRHIILRIGPPNGPIGHASHLANRLRSLLKQYLKLPRLRPMHITLETEIPFHDLCATRYFEEYQMAILELLDTIQLHGRLTVLLAKGSTDAILSADAGVFNRQKSKTVNEQWAEVLHNGQEGQALILALNNNKKQFETQTATAEETERARRIFYDQKAAELQHHVTCQNHALHATKAFCHRVSGRDPAMTPQHRSRESHGSRVVIDLDRTEVIDLTSSPGKTSNEQIRFDNEVGAPPRQFVKAFNTHVPPQRIAEGSKAQSLESMASLLDPQWSSVSFKSSQFSLHTTAARINVTAPMIVPLARAQKGVQQLNPCAIGHQTTQQRAYSSVIPAQQSALGNPILGSTSIGSAPMNQVTPMGKDRTGYSRLQPPVQIPTSVETGWNYAPLLQLGPPPAEADVKALHRMISLMPAEQRADRILEMRRNPKLNLMLQAAIHEQSLPGSALPATLRATAQQQSPQAPAQQAIHENPGSSGHRNRDMKDSQTGCDVYEKPQSF